MKHKIAAAFFLILLVAFQGYAADTPRKFTIISMNDVYEIFPIEVVEGNHSRTEGGFETAATMIREARQRGPVLLLHAGDYLSPSVLSNRMKHKGSQMVAAMNLLQFDAVTLGNHEFDFGCATLADRIREGKFPILSANVDLPSAMNLPPGSVQTARVFNIAGLKVGVFGLTLPLSPVEGCSGGTSITFRDPIAAARQSVAELKKQKADLIIALTHQLLESDRVLARSVPEIDLIVGGHDHEVSVTQEGKALIAKAGANATGLGFIEVQAVRSKQGWIAQKSWTRVIVDPKMVAPDPAMQKALEPYRNEMTPLMKQIGTSEIPLDVREDAIREEETAVGNYVADVMRKTLNADVALINGGSFRAGRVLPRGPLTYQDLYTMLPYDNEVLKIQVTGADLLKALENGVSLAGQEGGRFPQVSGVSFQFDAEKPAGSRILQVTVGGAPLKADATYTMATTDFILQRGSIDGYALPQNILEKGGNLNDMIVRSLQEAPLRAHKENRIVRE